MKPEEIAFRTIPSTRWTRYCFELCMVNANMSHDPSSQVGAVIMRPDKSIAAMGWNDFPRGVYDDPQLLENRDEKYKRVVHAELNAILNSKEPLAGHWMYVAPYPPCAHCASAIIQSGIRGVAFHTPHNAFPERWHGDFKIMRDMFEQTKVDLVYVTPPT